MLKNTEIIRVKGNNRKWKYLQKFAVNAPLFLKLHLFPKGCKLSNKPVIMVYWNGNQNQIIMAESGTKNQKVTKMHPKAKGCKQESKAEMINGWIDNKYLQKNGKIWKKYNQKRTNVKNERTLEIKL